MGNAVQKLRLQPIDLLEVGYVLQHGNAADRLAVAGVNGGDGGQQVAVAGGQLQFEVAPGWPSHHPAGQFLPRLAGSQHIGHRMADGVGSSQAEGRFHGWVDEQDAVGLVGDEDGIGRAGQHSGQPPPPAFGRGEQIGVLDEHRSLAGQRVQQIALVAVKVVGLAIAQVECPLVLPGQPQRQGKQRGHGWRCLQFGLDLRRRRQAQFVSGAHPADDGAVEGGHRFGRWPFGEDQRRGAVGIADDSPRPGRAGAAQHALEYGGHAVAQIDRCRHVVTNPQQQRQFIEPLAQGALHL